MCTLIVGRDVLGPGTLLLGANRDENPTRPTVPPGVLNEGPRLIGGRDRLGGGTWLALRDGFAAYALLNRHEGEPRRPPPGSRSRGLLLLDVARAPEDGPLGEAAKRALAGALARDLYAGFSLVFGSREACWLASSRSPETVEIGPGWHVLTHRELDDPSEPRAAHLVRALEGFLPDNAEAAERRLIELLRSHGEDGGPAVCIHEGAMPTVSSSVIAFTAQGTRYLHAEGRPCERRHEDQRALLLAPSAPRGAA